MTRRSSPWRTALLAVASLAILGCADDGGLSPVTMAEVAGIWVAPEWQDAGSMQVADTLRLFRDGKGSRSISWTSTVGGSVVSQSTSLQALDFSVRGAELDARLHLPCGPVTCMDGVSTPMRGLVRGDTLNLWYTGPQMHFSVGPVYSTFVRRSAQP